MENDKVSSSLNINMVEIILLEVLPHPQNGL